MGFIRHQLLTTSSSAAISTRDAALSAALVAAAVAASPAADSQSAGDFTSDPIASTFALATRVGRAALVTATTARASSQRRGADARAGCAAGFSASHRPRGKEFADCALGRLTAELSRSERLHFHNLSVAM